MMPRTLLVASSLSVVVLASFLTQSPRALLTRLVALDGLFFGIHVVARLLRLPLRSPLFLSTDQGFAEVFQYLKFALAATVWLVTYVRTRQPIMLGWGALFAYLVLDDLLELHENLATWLILRLGHMPTWGLLAEAQMAELVLGLALGGAVLFGLGLLYRRSDASARRVSRVVALLTMALWFCGVAIDAIHSAVEMVKLRYLDQALILAEDGGEMLVASAILAYARHVWTTGSPDRQARSGRG